MLWVGLSALKTLPTPHCSPCNLGLSRILSNEWENMCSDPLAGLLEPAILIAIPLLNNDFITNLALSSRPGLILLKLLVINFADIMDNEAADSLYSSYLSLCASCQSLTAVKFEIKSAQPADNRRKGECAIMLLSPIRAIGALA